MSMIIAVLCFYYGTNNIIAAFDVPFSSFETIHWLLLITGILLILFGIASTYQAVLDFKERENQKKNPKPTSGEKIEYETDYFDDDIEEDIESENDIDDDID